MAQSSERFILEGSGIPELGARRVPVAYHHFAKASDQLIALFGEIVPVLQNSPRWQGIGRPWLWRVTGNRSSVLE